MRQFIVAIIVATLLMSVLVVGCTKIEKVYICANGKEMQNASACPTNKVAGVKKPEAENYAKNFVNAYFLPYGGKSQLVSSYLNPDKGDFFATFIVAAKDGSPFETVVTVDGLTGKVNCTEKCDYLK